MLESSNRLDEEHRLIARYAARLAAESSSSVSSLIKRIHLLASKILEFHMLTVISIAGADYWDNLYNVLFVVCCYIMLSC